MLESQLKLLLEEEKGTIRFRSNGIEYSAEPILIFDFDKESGESTCKFGGILLEFNGQTKKYKDFEKFFKVFENDKIEIISINDKFKSIEEYENKKAFDNISMEGLLDIFAPLADSFSLTCPYNGGYDSAHQFGVYRIDEKLAEEALSQLEEAEKASCFKVYSLIPERQRAKLPPFEKLYGEIIEECNCFASKNQTKAEECGGNVFFCDEFAEGKTKYKEPEELWYLYHSAGFIRTCRYSLEKMLHNTVERPIDAELDEEEYKPLKNSLLNIKTGFVWHCTVSGTLSKTFYFKLDSKTLQWLKKYKNDYALCGLEDLAFYRDGKLLFTSCTHEKFHHKTEE